MKLHDTFHNNNSSYPNLTRFIRNDISNEVEFINYTADVMRQVIQDVIDSGEMPTEETLNHVSLKGLKN